MTGFRDTVGEILSRAARLLGLKPTEAQRLERMRERLAAARARNVDELEEIKERVKTIEARALRKKRELDEARGDGKRIIAGEIERGFRDLDRLRGRENICVHNIDRISLTLAKIDELAAVGLRGVDEDQVDLVAEQAEEAFAELNAADRAAGALEQVQYRPGEPGRVDVDERMRDMQERRKGEPELSPETRRRLKELEEE